MRRYEKFTIDRMDEIVPVIKSTLYSKRLMFIAFVGVLCADYLDRDVSHYDYDNNTDTLTKNGTVGRDITVRQFLYQEYTGKQDGKDKDRHWTTYDEDILTDAYNMTEIFSSGAWALYMMGMGIEVEDGATEGYKMVVNDIHDALPSEYLWEDGIPAIYKNDGSGWLDMPIGDFTERYRKHYLDAYRAELKKTPNRDRIVAFLTSVSGDQK